MHSIQQPKNIFIATGAVGSAALVALAGTIFVVIVIGFFASVFKNGFIAEPESQLAAVDGAGSGLVGHYTLDETSGTTAADSSGSFPGLLLGSGAVPQWSSGIISGGLTFDASRSESVLLGDDPAFSPGTGDLSISLWEKTSANFAAGDTVYLYDDYGGNSNNHIFIVFLVSNAIQAGLRDSNGNSASVTSSAALNDGNWHNILLARNGTSVYLYIDGALAGTQANASLGTMTTSDDYPPTLGAKSNAASGYFTGSIDDVRIYSRALAIDDAQSLYAGRSSGQTTNPPSQPPAQDTAAPIILSGSPSGQLPAGTVSATLLVTTNENATCKYGQTAGTAYASMASSFSTTGGTNHSTGISGLQNATSYIYYVRCADVSNNVDATDYQVSFSVAAQQAQQQPQVQTEWYVSPQGSSAGNGSLNNPWDLTTALGQPSSVKPGDTLWLRGGTYYGAFVSNLQGTADKPITVRSYPGEWAALDVGQIYNASGNYRDVYGLTVNGSYTRYWGFEIRNSRNDSRTFASTGVFDLDFGRRAGGVNNYGPYNKFIHLVIHDGGAEGLGDFGGSQGTEIYGNLIYNNGWEITGVRKHGEGIYAQNRYQDTKRITDNIILDNFDNGFQIYGSSATSINNFAYDGNAFFGNQGNQFLLGGGAVADNQTITRTYAYAPASRARGISFYGQSVNHLTLSSNYILAEFAVESPLAVPVMSASGNTFIGGFDGPISSQISSQTNTLISSLPSNVQVFIRPSAYEQGRANVLVFNGAHASSASVDLSATGLRDGDPYKIVDAQNFFGPAVVTGTYSSSNARVSVPLAQTQVSTMIGSGITAPPVHSSSDFNVFVVLKTSGSASIPQSNAPTDTNAGSSNTNTNANTVGSGGGGGALPANLSGGGGAGGVSQAVGSLGGVRSPTASSTLASGYAFSKWLILGTNDPEVKILQQVLNSNGFTVASTGTGSIGHESVYFGFATEQALKKFQCAKLNICSGSVSVNGYGATGPKTRAALSSLGSHSQPIIPIAAASASGYAFTRSLTVGSVGDDVKALQAFLNSQGFTIASSGAGSPGKESLYFGNLTKQALIRFQNAYAADILAPAGLTSGTGYLGANTIKKINSFYAQH